MPSIKIGLLDFGYRDNKASANEILKDTITYAILADQLGFCSFWLSEHHNSGMAWSNPEMLLPLIAEKTNRIGLGLTGILLAVHSPYRVALSFKLLENLFPGRIDLGMANGHVTEDIAIQLLGQGRQPEDFNNKVDELLHYFADDKQLWLKEKIWMPPFGGSAPRLWKLSRSFFGLEECLEKKLNLSMSMFHGTVQEIFDKSKINDFKNKYFERYNIQARVNIAFSGVCDVGNRLVNKSIRQNFPVPGTIVGPPSFFRHKVLELYDQTGVDEFMFFDMEADFVKRMKTLELLSKEFNLKMA